MVPILSEHVMDQQLEAPKLRKFIFYVYWVEEGRIDKIL